MPLFLHTKLRVIIVHMESLYKIIRKSNWIIFNFSSTLLFSTLESVLITVFFFLSVEKLSPPRSLSIIFFIVLNRKVQRLMKEDLVFAQAPSTWWKAEYGSFVTVNLPSHIQMTREVATNEDPVFSKDSPIILLWEFHSEFSQRAVSLWAGIIRETTSCFDACLWCLPLRWEIIYWVGPDCCLWQNV